MKTLLSLLLLAVAVTVSGQTTNAPGIRPPSGFTPTTNAPGTNVPGAGPIALPQAVTIDPTTKTVTQSSFWPSNYPNLLSELKIRNVAKDIGAYRGTFQPTLLSSLKLWLKADSLNLTDGASVTNWPDSSGNGNNATQSTGAQQPLYTQFALNGQPAVTFASTKRMATPSFLGASFNSNFTFVVVAYRSDISVNDNRYIAGVGTTWFCSRTPSDFLYKVAGSSTSVCSSPGSLRPYIEIFRYDGTNYQIRLNGINRLKIAQTNALDMSGAMTIGNTAANDGAWIGGICEVMVFKSALSDVDCDQIDGYLSDKYNIAKSLVIVDGDSLTLGIQSGFGSNYPALMMRVLGNSYDAVNLGMSGWQTSATITNTFLQVKQARSAKSVAVLLEGTNDLEFDPTSTNTIIANITKYGQTMRRLGYRFFICTITPRGDTSWQSVAAKETGRLNVNNYIRSNWTAFADGIIDTASFPQFSDPSNTNFFFTDKLHFNNVGYGVLATNVANAILASSTSTANPIILQSDPASWPTVPPVPGAFVFVASNTTVYLISPSQNKTNWGATNKVVGP